MPDAGAWAESQPDLLAAPPGDMHKELGHMGSMCVLLGPAWCPWESTGVHGMCTTHHLPCMLRAHGQQVGGPGTYLVPMGVHGI